MMVLQTLKLQPMHGYAIAQRIKQTSKELLQIEEGSLYPALQRMLKHKWVNAEWGVSATNRRVRIAIIMIRGLVIIRLVMNGITTSQRRVPDSICISARPDIRD